VSLRHARCVAQLEAAGSKYDDERMPKSHKIVFTTNPIGGKDMKKRIKKAVGELHPKGSVTEVLVDDPKSLAFVTVETPDDVSLSFDDVARLAQAADVALYAVGPINLDLIDP
jgi:hypothetical protein